MSKLIQILHPAVTTADVEAVWNEFVTLELHSQHTAALMSILSSVHHGLEQVGE